MARRSRAPLPEITPSYRGGSGEPLVLIHGFTDTWSTWRPILPALEVRHDVFAPTLPGHHGGERIAPGTAVSDATFADALERQLDATGIERAHLVGNSLGGWLALMLAGRGRALSAVAICPGGGWYPDDPDDRRIVRYFERNALAMRTGDWWIDPVAARPRLRRFALRDLLAHPERVTASQARTMFLGATGCEVVHEMIAHAQRPTLFGDLGPIDVPTRILYGTRDRLIRWPRCYRRLQALLPDSEYVALEGLGHMPMWDDPETVAARVLEVTAPGSGLTTQRPAPVRPPAGPRRAAEGDRAS